MLSEAKWSRLFRRLPLFLFLIVAQAHAGLFDDDVARQKIDEQTQEIQKLKADLEDATARLKKLEGGMIDMATSIQSQNADIAALRGKIEELQYGIDTSQKRQKDFYVDLDTRLRRLEPQAASSPAAVQPASSPAAAPTGEGSQYEAAFNLFRTGDYIGAISGFKDFLKSHPESSYAPSAQYWIGNAYFATKDFKNAISAQKELVSKYPDSQKVPDALINIASSQQELGQLKESRKTLKEVVRKYPSSDAAAKAKRRLEALK